MRAFTSARDGERRSSRSHDTTELRYSVERFSIGATIIVIGGLQGCKRCSRLVEDGGLRRQARAVAVVLDDPDNELLTILQRSEIFEQSLVG